MERDRIKRLSSVRVSLLCENTARGQGIVGEHGLSWWIEAEGHSVLFDLGQGIGLASNAARLGAELAEVDAIAISHGHYDHVGGWRRLPWKARRVPVFLHPDAMYPKYQRRKDGRVSQAGDRDFSRVLKERSNLVKEVREPTEVVDGIWLSGEIPRVTDFEDSGGSFFRDERGSEVDLLKDDQALFFDTEQGLVVILGCSHAGVINTLQHLRELSGRRIHAVVGGTHLLDASEGRIRRTVVALREIGPDFLGANHCSGEEAEAVLRSVFKGRYLECHAGQRIQFPIRRSKVEGRVSHVAAV